MPFERFLVPRGAVRTEKKTAMDAFRRERVGRAIAVIRIEWELIEHLVRRDLPLRLHPGPWTPTARRQVTGSTIVQGADSPATLPDSGFRAKWGAVCRLETFPELASSTDPFLSIDEENRKMKRIIARHYCAPMHDGGEP